MDTDTVLNLLVLCCVVGLGIFGVLLLMIGCKNIVLAINNRESSPNNSYQNAQSLVLPLRLNGAKYCFSAGACGLTATGLLFTSFTREVLIGKLILFVMAFLFLVLVVYFHTELGMSKQNTSRKYHGRILLLIVAVFFLLLGPFTLISLSSPVSYILLFVEIIGSFILICSFIWLYQN